MKTGQRVKVSPAITGLNEWIVGVIIKIRKNPFLKGSEIAIKDDLGRIFFGEEKYFKIA